MVIVQGIDARLANLVSGTRASKLARNSLLVMRERFAPSRPPLKVVLGEGRNLSATELSTVASALQEATARMAMLILRPRTDRVRVYPEIRERAKLISRSQVANVLYFDFPPTEPGGNEDQALLTNIHVTHLTEQAVRNLIKVLPIDSQDHKTLDALPGRRLGVRAAVSGLAAAVQLAGPVTLSLFSAGVEERSTLTTEQAERVPELLDKVKAERSEIPVDGILDGMRTRRLLFYINEDVEDGGREFEGSVTPDQLPALQGAMGQRVHARLRKVVFVKANGQRSHATYSLISLQLNPTI